MKKEEIEHLATLARIKVTEEESVALADNITEIIGYVKVVDEIVESLPEKKEVGPLNTVMRMDGEPHEAGKYTEDILAEMPDRDGQYLKVKKILGNDD